MNEIDKIKWERDQAIRALEQVTQLLQIKEVKYLGEVVCYKSATTMISTSQIPELAEYLKGSPIKQIKEPDTCPRQIDWHLTVREY